MCEITAISGDTILIECKDQSVELSTDNRIRLEEDFHMLDRGDIISVDPWINTEGEYQIYIWGDNVSKMMIEDDGIIELVCEKGINKL